MIDFTIDNIKLVSEANNSDHWTKKRQRRKLLQFLIRQHWNHATPHIILPCQITLTRIAPRKLDSDNLQTACKGIRDEIADLILPGKKKGQADSDQRLTWIYEQKQIPKTHALNIRITF